MEDKVVVVAHVLFQPEEKRFADALETDDMADYIGCNAVHAINLQHSQVLVVSQAVYPQVEDTHQQEIPWIYQEGVSALV